MREWTTAAAVIWCIAAQAAASPGSAPATAPATAPSTAPAVEASLTDVYVSSPKELRAALADLEPGTRILVAPGEYRGFSLRRFSARMDAPVVIAAADATDPPVFGGGREAIKLTSCSFIRLERLIVRGCRDNGINIDDGGSDRLPSRRIVLRHLTVEDIGPGGNHDAIKLSGVMDAVIRDCRISRWGGSAIDMVGCHRVVVDGCRFQGDSEARQKNSVQIKGGSSHVLVQDCAFLNAGERVVNLGGATGEAFFRPRGVPYEAKDVTIAGCRFVGGEAHIAWVTCLDTHVHHNIFYRPDKWVGRILQETDDGRFEPCGRGVFAHNLVVADAELRAAINVGRGTAPRSFAFRENAWYFADGRRPSLPVAERGGVHQVDPELRHAGTAGMEIGSEDPRLDGIGPRAYERWEAPENFEDVETPEVPPTTTASPVLGADLPEWLLYIAGATVLGAIVVGLVLRRVRGAG
mgnify:CR=1 FL=1